MRNHRNIGPALILLGLASAAYADTHAAVLIDVDTGIIDGAFMAGDVVTVTVSAVSDRAPIYSISFDYEREKEKKGETKRGKKRQKRQKVSGRIMGATKLFLTRMALPLYLSPGRGCAPAWAQSVGAGPPVFCRLGMGY